MTHSAPSPYIYSKEYEKDKIFRFGSTEITLPALKVDEHTVIYVLNIMGGNPKNISIFAKDLLYGLDIVNNMHNILPIDGFISVEGKSIPLVYEIASQADVPYIILRKNYKPYMGKEILSSKMKTITTGNGELYLDNKDLKWLVDKRLIFVDDVISSGATLNATKEIVNIVGGQIVGCLAMAIEGNYEPNIPTYSLTRLPIVKL